MKRACERVRAVFLTTLASLRSARAPAGRAAISPAAWQIATAFLVALLPAPAFGYTIQSAATTGCHEEITADAWRTALAMLPDGFAHLPSRGDDEALMADVPFDVPASMNDIGGVTLLLGVRDNDLKEHGPNGLTDLAVTASDPESQADHCLRAPDQDEPSGSRQAVESCRRFIRRALIGALDGLDAEGRPDTTKRDELRVSLAIRDRIDVPVPRFFLRAGRGLHALQDSFTHTFRSVEDPKKITVVLNFSEYTQDTLDPHEDGPAHASELDQCDDADELRTERRDLATEASALTLLALLNPDLSRAEKEREIDEVLDGYVAFDESAACTHENGWCEAPESKYGSPPLGCRAAGTAPHGGGALLALGLVGLALARRWRWRSGMALALPLAIACYAPQAHAEESRGIIDSPAAALAGESDAATPGKGDKPGAIFARLATGASYDNAAFSLGLGTRYQFATKWMVGFDAEWNPYAAISPSKLRTGSANAYASLIRRTQLLRADINIRSTVSLGASMLLFDLVGADRYSMGPYFGLSFLGVEWKMGRGFYLTIDPTYIAIPVPNIVGVPFVYAQYRFLVGLEFGR
jgi:hypothetical protein